MESSADNLLNKSQKRYLDTFESYLLEKGNSKVTIKNYLSDLRKFLVWKGKDSQFLYEDIEDYRRFLDSTDVAESTEKRILNTTKKFYESINVIDSFSNQKEEIIAPIHGMNVSKQVKGDRTQRAYNASSKFVNASEYRKVEALKFAVLMLFFLGIASFYVLSQFGLTDSFFVKSKSTDDIAYVEPKVLGGQNPPTSSSSSQSSFVNNLSDLFSVKDSRGKDLLYFQDKYKRFGLTKLIMDSELDVNEDANFRKDVNIKGDLEVHNDIYGRGGLTLLGGANFMDNVSVQDNFSVEGNATFNNISVGGGSTIEGGNITIAGSAPSLNFEDTTTGQNDYGFVVDNNNFVLKNLDTLISLLTISDSSSVNWNTNGSSFVVESGAFDINNSGPITIGVNGSVQNITFETANFDINSTGTVTIDGTDFTYTPSGSYSVMPGSTYTIDATGAISLTSASSSLLQGAGVDITSTGVNAITLTYAETGGTFELTDGTTRMSIADNGDMTLGDDSSTTTIDGSLITLSGNTVIVGTISQQLTDNTSNVYDLEDENSANYINISTVNGSEAIQFGNAVTNPTYSFLGSGLTTLGGNLTTTGDIEGLTGTITTLDGTTLTFTNANITNLNSVTAVDATTEATIETAIDTLANLTSVQGQAISFSGALTISSATTIDGKGNTLTLNSNVNLNQNLETTDWPTFAGIGIGATNPNYLLNVVGSANLSTGNGYFINEASVLNATTLGSGVVTSSLTTVGALNSGSITSGFGSIDVGIDSITTTGTGYFGTLDLGTNTITDGTLTGNWGFSSGNLSSIGTIGSGAITSTGQVQGLSLTDGTATLTSGGLTGLLQLIVDSLTFDGASITSDTGDISFDNENLTTTGDLHLGGAFYDSTNLAGDSTNILTSTGTGTSWSSITSAISSVAFIQNGNSFGTGAVLGTNDAYSLSFETNGIAKLYIDANGNIGIGGTAPSTNPTLYASASGNVGIGTTNPSSKLDVQGTIENGLLAWFPLDGDATDKSINGYTASVESGACPTGYVLVPGNATYGTSDFCVMQYEAKSVGGVATSQVGTTPWVNIDQTTAATACTNTGGHLITNNEWMTIARNVEQVSGNWSSGIVGTGGLFRGNVGNDDTLGYNGADPEFGTGRNAKASLTLSNGQVIWDLSGNVREWTSYSITCAGDVCTVDEMPYDATPAEEWVEFPNLATYGQMSYDEIRPSNSAWNSTYGMGKIYTDANTAYPSGRVHALIRGGSWRYTDAAGVFAADLGYSPSSAYYGIGFRCVR